MSIHTKVPRAFRVSFEPRPLLSGKYTESCSLPAFRSPSFHTAPVHRSHSCELATTSRSFFWNSKKFLSRSFSSAAEITRNQGQKGGRERRLSVAFRRTIDSPSQRRDRAQQVFGNAIPIRIRPVPRAVTLNPETGGSFTAVETTSIHCQARCRHPDLTETLNPTLYFRAGTHLNILHLGFLFWALLG